ncbi:glycerophosphodiester phosphodiesterase family protein [Actinopolymorpha pittospori]|uniref:Glycerophosphoryl diester phosphodiesterase n=2 Tax=Actinopolymorpha pittospori TaxID=648752 RepID=A0A927MN00_9ACTN|nr:glycerophosphodiester phosphodiesterase family protein [Actinopolymorpha pittospori]MBE1603680.1 glycerophosphoryl diester phosphodiesterase [Actinopolymorpha pittospori]
MQRPAFIVNHLRSALVLVAGLAAAAATIPPAEASPASITDTNQGAVHRANPRGPVVWSHRGASKNAPEETTAAYERALADGADVLEGDLAQTKDGVLVVIHDNTLARTTNVEEVFPDRAPWNVADFTLAEIKQLDAGSWWDPAFAGQQILTLHEWFELNHGRAGLAPELKSPTLYPGMVENLAKELRAWGYTHDLKAKNRAPQIWVQSFDEAGLRQFHALLPEVPTLLLRSGYPFMTASDEVLTELATWTTAVAGNPVQTTASQVRRVQSFGLQVVSEVEDGPSLLSMIEHQGYDYMFTDVPNVAKAVLADKKPLRTNRGVIVDSVVYNPEGSDVAVNGGEYVALRNTTDKPINISGYTLREFGNTLLRVGDDAVIEPGSLYKVYVGPGTDRPNAHFNGLTTPVLADTVTDHIYLYNPDQVMEDLYSYIAS